MSVINKMMSLLGLSDEEVHYKPTESQEAAVEEEINPQFYPRKGATVVNLHTQKQVRLVLCEGKEFDDTQTIADHLRARRPVVMNLHKAPYEVAVRILDFIAGTTYALGGRMEKLGQNVFLCAPENVEIHGEITEIAMAELIESSQVEHTKQTGR